MIITASVRPAKGSLRTRSLRAVAGLVVALVPGTATAAPVMEDTCRGIQARIQIPVENVDPLVPDEPGNPNDFTIAGDPATVAVGAVQCDLVTVGANARPKTEFVTFRVDIEDPDPFDMPPPGYVAGGSAYTLWFASNNRDMVEYYRERGDVPNDDSVYDPRLSIKMPAEGESGQLKVDAPSAPSPFEMKAIVEPLLVGPLNLAPDFWAKVPTGTMVQRPDLLDEVRLGGVMDGELKPQAGSEMDRVFCDDVPRTSRGAVLFSGPAVPVESFRLFFLRGQFTVGVDHERQPSAADSVTC